MKTIISSTIAFGLLAAASGVQAQVAGGVGGTLGGAIGGSGATISGSANGGVAGDLDDIRAPIERIRDRTETSTRDAVERAGERTRDSIADVTTDAREAPNQAQERLDRPVSTGAGADIATFTPAGSGSGSVRADAHVEHDPE